MMTSSFDTRISRYAIMRAILAILVLNVFIIRTSSIQHKVVATNTPQKSKGGSSIFDKLRIPEETKMLPWQATLLLRIIKPKFLMEQDEKFLLSSSSPREKLMSVQLISNACKWLERGFESLSKWALSHKKNFNIAAKSSVLVFIGNETNYSLLYPSIFLSTSLSLTSLISLLSNYDNQCKFRLCHTTSSGQLVQRNGRIRVTSRPY